MTSLEEVAARTWASRARQEGEAAHAFARIARSLRVDDAPEPLVAAASDSGNEEVRHAVICRDLVAQLGGRCEIDAAERHASGATTEPLRGAALVAELVAVCCITESLSAVLLTAMIERCEHDGVLAVLREVLRDEITHSRIGWGYLTTRRDALRSSGIATRVGLALPRMLADTVPERVFEPDPHPTLATELEHLGCLSRATIADLFHQTLTEVVVPGLEESGIETAAARQWMADRFATCGTMTQA